MSLALLLNQTKQLNHLALCFKKFVIKRDVQLQLTTNDATNDIGKTIIHIVS